MTFEKLAPVLAPQLFKFFVKLCFGKEAADLSAGPAKLLEAKLTQDFERRDFERQLVGISEKVVQQLVPLFDPSGARDLLAPETIAGEVAQAIDGVSVELLLEKDLDAGKLVEGFRKAHTLQKPRFSDEEEQVYFYALNEVADYLVEVAASSPGG